MKFCVDFGSEHIRHHDDDDDDDDDEEEGADCRSRCRSRSRYLGLTVFIHILYDFNVGFWDSFLSPPY